jgi:transcriptional regulator GlxA family with amidase domain
MHHIAFVALPGFRMMTLASLSAFELANSEAGEPVYELHLLSETGGSFPPRWGSGS